VGFIGWYANDSGVHSEKTRLSRLLNNQQVDDGSAGTRLAALHDGLRLIEQAPLLGHGTGFSRTMQELPHNIYVQQWVNNGILGILAYLLFLGAAYSTFSRRGCRNGQVVILVAAVGGIFSHNVLDQRPFLILLGILLAYSYQEQQAARRQLDTGWLLRRPRIAPMRAPAQRLAADDQVLR
jgi:O-antigen ligase